MIKVVVTDQDGTEIEHYLDECTIDLHNIFEDKFWEEKPRLVGYQVTITGIHRMKVGE